MIVLDRSECGLKIFHRIINNNNDNERKFKRVFDLHNNSFLWVLHWGLDQKITNIVVVAVYLFWC
jgi:hypothetical protein